MRSSRSYILAITSDEPFGRSLQSHLASNGYEVRIASDVPHASRAAQSVQPSLLVIDRRTKDIGHIFKQDSLRNITIQAVEPPGSSCNEDECVEEIEKGFNIVICGESYRQLIARIRAVLRRDEWEANGGRRLVVGRVAIDLDRCEVTVDGHPIEITRTQYKILELMMREPMRAFTRNEILEKVWGDEIAILDHTLDVHIHALRTKIERDPSAPLLLQTVRGVGYRMRPPA
jgi:DNA-binding response OmpR family regulator